MCEANNLDKKHCNQVTNHNYQTKQFRPMIQSPALLLNLQEVASIRSWINL